ncbi:MAG: branched-chain amino acid ABC transporter permease, partial [Chloroflexi bacterium]|nr:branched-chain amino acid ABC transporter permease [Chloroflexota bacterium]
LVGIPALRLSGPYLAIATLSLAIATPQIVKKYDDFTGGTQGIGRSDGLVQPGPPGFLSDLLNRDQWLYFVVLVTLLAMTLLAWFILRGRIGRSFVAVRDAEVAAAAMGINVARTKVTAFAISAFYAGTAGALFVQVQGIMTPDSIGILQSITFLTSIVIGGLASILGSIIGAAFVVYLPSDITDLFKKLVAVIPGFSADTIKPGALQGAAVVLVMLLMPAGVAGFLIRLTRLRPAAVLQGVRSAPAGLRSGGTAARERLSSLWDVRPGRRGPSHPESPEDEERG